MSCWSVPFEFSFCEEKTRFTHAIAAKNEKNVNLVSYFPRRLLNEQR